VKLKILSLAIGLGLIGQPCHAEILIGFVTGLSGPVSSIGIPNSKGLKAGELYTGDIGGQKIRVIQLDDASDPTSSTQNARKLIEENHVDMLIGTSGTPQTTAMATIASQLKTPMVAVSPVAAIPQSEGGPWVVQIPQPASILVDAIVDHMKKSGIKSVAFLGFSDAFGDLMYNSLVNDAKGAGIQVIANERYGRADTSVTGQALKVISSHPDAVMLGGTGTPGALPVLALKQLGLKGPIYGNHGMISADFLRIAGDSADGIICPTGPVTAAEQLPASNPIRKVALAYLSAYKTANGAEPTDSFAAYGFDGWLAFADAAKRALDSGAKPGTPEFRKALREALFSTKELVGTQGVYNFKVDNSPWVDKRSVVLVQIEHGKYQLIP
jgi:branched-chain amino acid transport system substrate-binding protein